MSVRVGCPFCNHKVVLDAVPATGRAACDRCGETFPVTGDVEQVADPAPAEPSDTPPQRSWLWLPPFIGITCGLLAVAFFTYTFVLNPVPKPTPAAPPPQSAGPVTWPPPALPLLRHLPPDTGLAVAVQTGPLLAHAKRTDTDPQKLLADLGVPDRVFTTLAELGLSLDRIDQVVGGLVFPADNAIPRIVVAVKPVGPPGDVLGKLKAARTTTVNRQPASEVLVGGRLVTVQERDGALVFATAVSDLERSPAVAGSGYLPAGLRDTLGQLSPSAFAWAASDAADWGDKPTVKAAALLLKRADLSDRLKPVRAAAVGVSLEPVLTAKVALKAAGDDKALQERLAAAVAGKDVLVGGADGWVTLAAKPADVPGLVGR